MFTTGTTEENQEAEALLALLVNNGYEGIYGGGKESKGHGFWIQKGGVTVKNNGRHSGNPCFWMYANLLSFLTFDGAKCPCGLPATCGLCCSEACSTARFSRRVSIRRSDVFLPSEYTPNAGYHAAAQGFRYFTELDTPDHVVFRALDAVSACIVSDLIADPLERSVA